MAGSIAFSTSFYSSASGAATSASILSISVGVTWAKNCRAGVCVTNALERNDTSLPIAARCYWTWSCESYSLNTLCTWGGPSTCFMASIVSLTFASSLRNANFKLLAIALLSFRTIWASDSLTESVVRTDRSCWWALCKANCKFGTWGVI